MNVIFNKIHVLEFIFKQRNSNLWLQNILTKKAVIIIKKEKNGLEYAQRTKNSINKKIF